VLCVDEKSQIQALDRTQPGLPLKKGRAATMTHDYKMGWLPPSPTASQCANMSVVKPHMKRRGRQNE